MATSSSCGKNLVVVDEQEQSTAVETNCPKFSKWIGKKKRSVCKTEEKKTKTNQVYEDIVKEIKSFAKDEKEEQKYMQAADLVYLIRTANTIPQEDITEIKTKHGKAEQVAERPNYVEPPLKRSRKEHQACPNFSDVPSSSKGVRFMNSSTRNLNSEKPYCPKIKRKIEKGKGKSVVLQKKTPHEDLVKEAEKREQCPPLVVVMKILRMNGSFLKFLMEKTLLDTDMSDGHDRLSMPKLQVAREFLYEEEIEEIKSSKYIDVHVIEPCGLESSLRLSIWKSGSEVYILRSCWRDIANREENGLEAGIKVQIWCFRKENNQLCFHIVKADDADEELA